jgi:hypothetical protein
MEASFGVSGLQENVSDHAFVEHVRAEHRPPWFPAMAAGLRPGIDGTSIEWRNVVIARCGHSFERVVQPDVSVFAAQVLERQDHREDRAASPDATLGKVARDLAPNAIANGFDQGVNPEGTRHGVRADTFGDRDIDL